MSELIVPHNQQQIAVDALRRCYKDRHAISACGEGGNFSQGVWLRDAVWGALGALAAGEETDVQKAKQVLELFLPYSPDIPFRIMPYCQALYLINLRIKNPSSDGEQKVPRTKRLLNRGSFRGEPTEVADSFLILMLAGNYLSSVNVSIEEKKDFWSNHQNHIEDFLNAPNKQFLFNNPDPRSVLIYEGPLGSRQDAILKSGYVFLTNVLWYKTLVDLAAGIGQVGENRTVNNLEKQARQLRYTLNHLFWNEEKGHYIDWLTKEGEKFDYFDSLANFLAVAAGVADPEQRKYILDFVTTKENLINKSSGLVASVDRPYAPNLIDRGMRLVRFPGYYNGGDLGVFWPETTIMYAAALKADGRDHEAGIKLSTIENYLLRNRTLYEAYDGSGDPLDRRIAYGIHRYRSPSDFAMALGNYLWVKANWDRLQHFQPGKTVTRNLSFRP